MVRFCRSPDVCNARIFPYVLGVLVCRRQPAGQPSHPFCGKPLGSAGGSGCNGGTHIHTRSSGVKYPVRRELCHQYLYYVQLVFRH